MKKQMIKILLCITIVLFSYILLLNVLDTQSIFDNWPWIKPIGLILCGVVMLYNVRRDILSNKKN